MWSRSSKPPSRLSAEAEADPSKEATTTVGGETVGGEWAEADAEEDGGEVVEAI